MNQSNQTRPLKTGFHNHCLEDSEHCLTYCSYELIEAAAKKGFEVLAITCHKKFVWNKSIQAFAQKHNILLIPGIEQNIERRHVLILNVTLEIKKVKTFAALATYKKKHPECFVIAPHPYFVSFHCLGGKKLREHHQLFDAIEFCHYYCPQIDRNKPAIAFAQKFDKPMLATDDLHYLSDLGRNYSLIQSEKNIPAIFEAIRQNKVKIVSKPRHFFELPFFHFKILAGMLWHLPQKIRFWLHPERCPFCKQTDLPGQKQA